MSLYGVPLLIMIYCYCRIFLKITFHESEAHEKKVDSKDCDQDMVKDHFRHKKRLSNAKPTILSKYQRCKLNFN